MNHLKVLHLSNCDFISLDGTSVVMGYG